MEVGQPNNINSNQVIIGSDIIINIEFVVGYCSCFACGTVPTYQLLFIYITMVYFSLPIQCPLH